MKDNTFIIHAFLVIFILSQTATGSTQKDYQSKVSIMILGIAQDAGYPQIHCQKMCCEKAWEQPSRKRHVACIALLDHKSKSFYLIDATPDIKEQIRMVHSRYDYDLAGILLTHAHMGHYTGLMHLGREAMNANKVPVYAMPRMSDFLRKNGPWSQLVTLNNIALKPISHNQKFRLSQELSVTPYLVPHRDEFSETVGFHIESADKSAWYIPDIDKWSKWDIDLLDILNEDFCLLDGTFYQEGEIPGRNMDEIPHPFIVETMSLLKEQPIEVREKLHFIHFNHTNPALWDNDIRNQIEQRGFNLAAEGQILALCLD